MVFDMLCRRLDECYNLLKEKKTRDILTEWRHYTILLGQEVIIEMADKKITGKVLDISNDGSLVVMNTNGKIERVVAGTCHLKQRK